jgi:hypothetical protein
MGCLKLYALSRGVALADDLGISPKNRKSGNSVFTRVSATYPSLVVVKRGSPKNGSGTCVHPSLVLKLNGSRVRLKKIECLKF